MSQSPLLLACTAMLLFPAARAQQPLSFEPGGPEACAQATHTPIPAATDDPRAFATACAAHDLQIQKSRFDALSREIEARSAEERIAFNALMVTFTAFRDAQASTCSVAIGCATSQETDKVQINYDFLQLAQQRTTVPPSTAEELASADAALNALYEKVLASLPETCPATQGDRKCVSQSTLRDTERDWIRYRDAWLTFGPLRYPQITATAWSAILTRQRTQQLKATLPVK